MLQGGLSGCCRVDAENGQSPLHMACRGGHAECVKLLLLCSPDVNLEVHTTAALTPHCSPHTTAAPMTTAATMPHCMTATLECISATTSAELFGLG